jgi:hypothetical protein
VTAKKLLAALAPFGAAVEGDELVPATDPPPELLASLAALHTGCRALLTGKRWFGSSVADGARPVVLELNPSVPVPSRIGLLCVEGDVVWDRVPVDAGHGTSPSFAPAWG